MPDKITNKIFADVDAGYAAYQAGELDVMYTIPPARYKEAKAQYADLLYEAPGDSFTYVGLPLYNDNFKDKRIRQALSLRSTGSRSSTRSSTAGTPRPRASSARPSRASAPTSASTARRTSRRPRSCSRRPVAGRVASCPSWANAGAGHEKWLQAVGDQIKAALGIDYEIKVNLQFPEYLATADANKFTGPFRLGWGPDYPVIESYLKPLYGTGGSSNNSTTSTPSSTS